MESSLLNKFIVVLGVFTSFAVAGYIYFLITQLHAKGKKSLESA